MNSSHHNTPETKENGLLSGESKPKEVKVGVSANKVITTVHGNNDKKNNKK